MVVVSGREGIVEIVFVYSIPCAAQFFLISTRSQVLAYLIRKDQPGNGDGNGLTSSQY